MFSTHPLAAPVLAATLLCTGLPALAGGDHDHGDAAPSATGSALPRFAAVSDSFELVGVLDGQQLTLYLDRFADNAPVRGATLVLDIAGTSHQAEALAPPQGDGTYRVTLKDTPKPGVLPITATVTVGNDSDLLAGELDLHAAAPAADAGHAGAWTQRAGWAAAALALLAALVLGSRRLMLARATRTGGAA